MTTFALKRVGSALLVLLGVTVIVFLLLQLVPGDPARAILGQGATEDAVAQLREELGLNASLAAQYTSYLGGLFTGDLGTSISQGMPVVDLLLPKLGNTLILAGAALVIAVGLGVPLGVIAAKHQGGWFDRIAMALSLGGASAPVYWAGLVGVAVFSLNLGWVPTGGMYNARAPGGFGDLLAHLVLPAIVAALVPLAVIARLTRAEVIEALSGDYVTVLRASGISERVLLWKHVLRNALPSLVGIIGLQIGYLLGGVIFVEVVFQWPGLGQQLYTAITANDLPIVQAGVLFVAASFVLLNLISDLLTAILDPRAKAA